MQFCLLLSLCTFLFFYRLGDRDLWSSHEGRAAQDAQSILSDGRWGLPHLFDQRYLELQKPPLFYWLVASIAAIRNAPVDAWDVRLPAALAGLATVIGLYLFAAACGRRTAGFAAAGIAATAQHYTALARIGRIDMPLTLSVSISLWCFYLGWWRQRGERRGAWLYFLIAYAAVAAGLLLKGPIGLILPAAAAAAFLLVEGELPLPWQFGRCFRLARATGILWGLPLVAVLACPWYIWADLHSDGALFRTFLWYHNVERALGSGGLRAHPWWFYVPRLTFDFLPWTPLLAVAGWWLYRRRERWREDPEARFGLAWLGSMFLVLSCAGFKRADYLVPAYPGAALVIGCVGEQWLRAVRVRWRLIAAYGVVVAGCAAAWLVYLHTVTPREDARREDRSFASAIRRFAPAPQTILFFRLEEHALAFHVGRPLYTLMEWENLDAWAAKPQTLYVVMTPEIAAEWPAHLKAGRLEEVLRNGDLNGGDHERPLVLFRTRPANDPSVH